MILFDYLVNNNGDYACYDDNVDICVTVCFDGNNENEPYDVFCNKLYKLVDCVGKLNNYSLVVDWYGFIKKNYTLFKEYANEFWFIGNHDDEDDFICEWIKELGLYISGYADDEQYEWMTTVLDKCEA